MEHVKLGRSGLTISAATLGAMNFGRSQAMLRGCTEAEAKTMVDVFLDAGGLSIDTADFYNEGESERIVGRAVKDKRDKVVLATKAFMPQGDGPNQRGLSRVHLTRALDASLRRLGTDYIDLYQCHNWDAGTPIEETMATLDGFVRAGKVRYLGCSNFTAAQVVEAQWAADRGHGTAFISLQPQYSLLHREIEADVLDTCERHGMGTLIWSPLGGGVLAGRYRRGVEPDADSRVARLRAMSMAPAQGWADSMVSERNLDIAELVTVIAAELRTTPATVALAWARGKRGVTSVIIGPRTEVQLSEHLAALGHPLPAEVVQRLDDATAPDSSGWIADELDALDQAALR